MNGPALDPRFAAGLRAALAEEVAASTVRPRRRWRPAAVGGAGVLVVVLAGGSVAVASGLVPLPFRTGAPYDRALAPEASSAHTGPVSVPLDGAPAGTSGARLDVTCLTPGTLGFPDGSSLVCAAGDEGERSSQTVDVVPGGGPLLVDATAGMRWELRLTWLQRVPTDWQTNARGETFGVVTADGAEPDLVAAVATDGARGYVRSSDLRAAAPEAADPDQALQWSRLPQRTVTVPVYASDGTTVLGEFEVVTSSPAP